MLHLNEIIYRNDQGNSTERNNDFDGKINKIVNNN